MQALQTCDLWSTNANARDHLQDVLPQRHEAHEPVEVLEAFEQDLPNDTKASPPFE